ncbi:DedA family protein [Paenibacillus sp. NPDC058071]|uniref:DedA family protein n=1 Tax=Paenibacillus sp. NPDC058071 TaxID=3346326 RepID=UPI0036D8F56C
MEHLSLLIIRYGYIGIFSILAVGIIGLPVPDEVLLTYVGYLIYQGKLMFVIALLSAFLGAAVGISVSYAVGLKLGLPFLNKFGPKVHITPKRIEWTQNLFNKYGAIVLIIGYFIPGVRHITAYIAGMSRMNLRTFMLCAYSGAILWVGVFIFLGLELGKRWYLVDKYVHKFGYLGIVVGALLLVGAYVFYRVRFGGRTSKETAG